MKLHLVEISEIIMPKKTVKVVKINTDDNDKYNFTVVKTFQPIERWPELLVLKKQRHDEDLNGVNFVNENFQKCLARVKNIHNEKHLLFEYINGVQFGSSTVPEEEIYQVVYQLCLDIKTLHSQDLCFADIKPENIIVEEDSGKIKWIDTSSIRKTGNKNIYITYQFTPPELIGKRKPKASKSQDIWSLSCLIFETLIGIHPFSAENSTITIKNISNCTCTQLAKIKMMRIMSKELRELLEKTWILEPKNRPTIQNYCDVFYQLSITETK